MKSRFESKSGLTSVVETGILSKLDFEAESEAKWDLKSKDGIVDGVESDPKSELYSGFKPELKSC